MIHFAGYQVERLVATGAFGAIYEARHRDLPTRRVALKVLKAESPDPRHVERFIREIEALGKIDHPNVVRVHAAGTGEDGRLYLAMELVDGPNLEQALANGAETERAMGWLLDAARGIAALHEKGIVHRDLKPSNVLIDLDGRARICDLGIARLVDRRTVLTAAGEVMGTLAYMSPEQAEGRVAGPPTDIFALGAMLYRVLAGRAPYDASSELEALVLATQARPLAFPDEDGRKRMPLAEAVCLKAMSAAPEARYKDAASFAADLERALAEKAGLAVRERRARRLARSGAFALVAVGLGAVVFLASRGGPDAAPGPAVPGTEIPKRRAALDAAVQRSRDERGRSVARRLRGEPALPDGVRAALTSALEGVAALTSGDDPTRSRSLRTGYLEAALDALAADDATGARANVSAALAQGEDTDALLVSAEVERALEEPGRARAALVRAPRDPRVTLSLLTLEVEGGRGESAIASAPGDAPGLTLLAGEAALFRGEGEAALALANRALAPARAAGTESPAELALAALARLALGDPTGALEDAGRACQRADATDRAPGAWLGELAPILGAGAQSERAHRARARVLEALGERHAACRELELAAAACAGKRAARLELARAELAELLLDLPTSQAALVAAERRGLAPEAALVRARLAFAEGDFDAARQAVLTANDPAARVRLALMNKGSPGEGPPPEGAVGGWLFQERGELDAAAERAEAAIAREGSAEAWSLRARLRLGKNDAAGAAADLVLAREALGRGPLAKERRLTLILASLVTDPPEEPALPSRDLLQEAERRLRRAAFVSLADAEVRRLLARLARKDGRPREALAWAEEAVRADPLDPEAQLEVGLAAFELGTPERGRARAALARVVAAPATKGALVEAGVTLSRIALEEGELAGACQWARGAMGADPLDPRGREALAKAAPRSPDEADRLFLARDEAAGKERLLRLRAADERAANLGLPGEPLDDAVAGLSEAIALAPTSARIELRARTSARRFQYVEALEDEARATLLLAGSALGLMERARTVVDTLGHETARARLDALVRSGSGEPASRLAHAVVLFACGLGSREPGRPAPADRAALWRDARGELDDLVLSVPSPGLLGVRAFFGRAAGRDEEPAADLRWACRAASREGVANLEYLQARACGVSGDRRVALGHVERAIEAGFADTQRAVLDMRPGTEGWFQGDAEVQKRLAVFVGNRR